MSDRATERAQTITARLLEQKSAQRSLEQQVRRLENQLTSERTAHSHELEQCRKHEATTVAAVREEYESTITRHLSFIDQLIADKNDLSSTYYQPQPSMAVHVCPLADTLMLIGRVEKCEDLVMELKSIHNRYSAKIKHIEEHAASTLAAQRQVSSYTPFPLLLV